jgi:integrase/recombinase XerD
MASVSIVFRKEKINKAGKAPIHFRIIKNRKISYISSSIMLETEHWDEKNKKIKGKCPHSGRLNSLLYNRFNEIQDSVLAMETYLKPQTSRQIKNMVFGSKPIDFFEYTDGALKKYESEGRIGTYQNLKSRIQKLKDYMGNKSLTFNDIDPKFLNEYETYLRTIKKNATNTIHGDLKAIRIMYNKAIADDLIEASLSPFRKYKLKTAKTTKTILTEDELKLIEEYKCTPGTKMDVHKDMFIFGCYAGGVRISDILKLRWMNFDGTHINFTIKKTGQQLSIKLPNKALEIISKYKPKKENKDRFIFPLIPNGTDLGDPGVLDKVISSQTAYTNKNLKIIAEKVNLGKHISFHVSRHQFACMALKKGISLDKVSKILAHQNIRETQVYAKIMNQEIDKAMEAFN